MQVWRSFSSSSSSSTFPLPSMGELKPKRKRAFRLNESSTSMKGRTRRGLGGGLLFSSTHPPTPTVWVERIEEVESEGRWWPLPCARRASCLGWVGGWVGG